MKYLVFLLIGAVLLAGCAPMTTDSADGGIPVYTIDGHGEAVQKGYLVPGEDYRLSEDFRVSNDGRCFQRVFRGSWGDGGSTLFIEISCP